MKDSLPSQPGLPTYATLLVALVGPPLFIVVPDLLFGESRSIGLQVVIHLLYCGLAVFVVWVVVRLERLPLSSIGLRRPGWSTLVTAAVVTLVTLGMPLITGPLMDLLGTEGFEEGLRRLAPMPAWFRIVVGVTAGAVEETLYRGYAVERLAAITGRLWLGGALAALAFGLAHIPAWGVGFALAADLPFGIVATLCYLWRRDLLANILVHSTGLVIAMLTTVP